MLMPRFSEQDNLNDNNLIGQHGHASTTVAAHTKMRLLSKVEHNMRQNQQNQNQSINKLIHTAATGNGLVGDVDELLMPMRIKAHLPNGQPDGIGLASGCEAGVGVGSFNGSSAVSNGKESHTRPERNLWSRAEMLEMLNIMQQMNALEQLNDRNVKSEHVFRQIEEVMRSKGYVKKSSIQIWTKWKFLKSTYNTTTRHGNGVPKVVPEEVYRVLCRMLRENASANGNGSGIGSECGNSMDSSNAELGKTLGDSEDCKDELGVEHPIFGFRLGLVKSEPLDTGYETALNHGNSSEQEIETMDSAVSGDKIHEQTQPLEHTPFMVAVKHEPEMDLGMDGTNTPPPTAPTSPSPPPPTSTEQRELVTSTPLPPLRVASFANDAQRRPTPTHGVLQIERPSLPQSSKASLSASLPGKLNRTLPLHSTSSINFVHPTSKLMLPRKQLPMRIPREISVQPTRPLKPVPMRETGYSLRPERMIPDLEQSISPPQSPSPPMHSQPLPKYTIPYASTSRQAQLLSEQQQSARKRRLHFQQPSPVPIKLQRTPNLYEHKDHDVSAAVEQRKKLAAEETQRRKQHQEELFKTELSQLANAMRVAQKEMLQDFFRQQEQFARREHEFQLKQDNLVMSALRKQTDALLRTAKDLIQTEEELLCPNTETQLQKKAEAITEMELQHTLQEHEENERAEAAAEAARDGELEQYEEDTQYSDEGNHSETAMETSTSINSEDASSHSDNPSEAQLF